MRQRTHSPESVDTSAATMGGGNDASNEPSRGTDPSTTASTSSNKTKNSDKSEYVNYLTSYEGMVRHQDLEFDATWGHMKNIFERIQSLGSKKTIDGEADAEAAYPRGMLTYLQIRRCLLRMGVGWNRSVVSVDNNADYDDDVSVLSFNSASSAGSRSGIGSSTGRTDIISTDAQLIMLLTALVETEEKYRASRGIQNRNYEKNHLDQGLFLPEFIQAYKLIIGGMQSLKSIPNSIFNSNDAAELALGNRLKERTMGMIRPFGPDYKMYTDEDKDNAKSSSSRDALSSKKRAFLGKVQQGKGSMGGKKSRAAKMSKFSNDDMRKVMRTKDNTLTKIMEEHELEMDALASSMETLRLEEEQSRVALQKRRKRTRLFVLVVGGILLAVGLVAESRRRAFLANEIALGREAERLAVAETIAQLKEKKSELEKKLGVIEGKMRYQISKNDGMDVQLKDVDKRIDDVEMKWLMDKAEIERCLTSQVEMSEELQLEQSIKEEVDEELVWCNSRLRSRQRELNELEHVDVGGDNDINEKVTSRSASGSDNESKNEKPVYLEMKYNKSIRNSMVLRQAYSAVGGLAASVILQVLVPAAIKLFIPKTVVVPHPPVPTRRVEMKLVDGIFGSSIAFLLVQAIATFVTPL